MRATGDAKTLGLLNGVLLALGVDDEERGRGALELTGATKVGLQLGELLAQDRLLLLATQSHGAIGDHALELLEAVHAGTDGHEVGEHATEPTLVDVRHVGALGSGLHGLLGLLLGANKEDLTTLGRGLLEEGVRLIGLDDGLLEVEDVDVVALAEDERLHLRFQRRVWWPKWQPASSRVRMLILVAMFTSRFVFRTVSSASTTRA